MFVREWKCIGWECESTIRWSYEDLAERGRPYCPKCGADMELVDRRQSNDLPT